MMSLLLLMKFHLSYVSAFKTSYIFLVKIFAFLAVTLLMQYNSILIQASLFFKSESMI